MPKKDHRAPRFRVVPIAEVRSALDPDNARRHLPANRSALRASLERFGAGRSGLIDGDGVVRAGNGTVEAAVEAGIEEALVIESDGRRLVLVERSDLRGAEAVAYALTDNRTTDLSEFDWERLAARIPMLEEAGINLEPLGWQPHELEPLRMATWAPPAAGGEPLGGEDTSRTTPPVRVTAGQRAVFERAVERARQATGRDLGEGEVLAMLAGWFLDEGEVAG